MRGRVLSPEEIEAIFKRFPKDNPYYLPLLLAYECGLSKGEVFGLTTKSLRKRSDYLHINYNAYFDRKLNQTILIRVPEKRVYAPRVARKALQNSMDLYFNKPTPRLIDYVDEGLLMVRPDGSYITPQGINYVARVIHGKTSHIDYVDPDWQFEDMAVSKIA